MYLYIKYFIKNFDFEDENFMKKYRDCNSFQIRKKSFYYRRVKGENVKMIKIGSEWTPLKSIVY